MAERKKLILPKKIIDKYGEKPIIWSYSRLGTFNNCVYEYYLSRIKRFKSVDNIYTISGSIAHDILEDFYDGKIKYEDMKKRFEQDFLEIETSDYKFSSDQEKNLSMRNKYKNCVMHFFKNHQVVESKVLTEKHIWIDVRGHLFTGYIDAIHKEGDYFIITDYKTSNINGYKGKKLKQNQKQLLLYALGLHQLGIPLNKIKIRWNFLKYLNIKYSLKNGKTKITQAERHKWVDKIKNPLKKDIVEKYDIEEYEADIKIIDLIKQNSLDGLHEDIVNKYKIEDCYVYGDISEETITELLDEIEQDILKILERGKEEDNWERENIQSNEEFYCNVLCGVRKHCKYYSRYLDELKKLNDIEEEEANIIAELENL